MDEESTIDVTTLTPRTVAVISALERSWGQGNVDALDAVLAPSYVRRGRRSRQSKEELKSSILDMRRAFPDLDMRVTRVVEGENDLALYWTSSGTLHDEYLGLPPTGRQYSVSGATFSHFEGDRIVEENVIYDRRGKYSSLGVPLSGSSTVEEPNAKTAVGIDVLRSMHRKMVTGVTVVAVDSDGEPRGLAVNAFSSVSLEPPLILVCVQKSSSTYSHLIAASHFSVSVLAADQLNVAKVFATKQERKFDQVAWHHGEHGVPLIDGAAAAMELELQDTLHASTHTIFIGRVRRITTTDAAPLVYTNGAFFDGAQLIEASESPA
ncbi:oxidoreductase [Microbacterium sp. CH12i]|uniref:flavin reductase n=1 Tax=Microbacterium sp. CH12i TaxID=1479651 RepID=UPI000461F835|nr:flavin reductase [Microbacterium sp. CH12i]KDA06726.1 oxidoreductase [Microbacterium sp. CH12i]